MIMYRASICARCRCGAFAGASAGCEASYLGSTAQTVSPTDRLPLYSRANPSTVSPEGFSSVTSGFPPASPPFLCSPADSGCAVLSSVAPVAESAACTSAVRSRISRPRCRISSALSWTRLCSGSSSVGTANILLM